MKEKLARNKKFIISLIVVVLLALFMFALVNSNNGTSKADKAMEERAAKCVEDLFNSRLIDMPMTKSEKEVYEIKWSANSSGQILIFIDAQSNSNDRAIYAYIDGEYAGNDMIADMNADSYSSEDKQAIEKSKQIRETWNNTSKMLNVKNVMKKVK